VFGRQRRAIEEAEGELEEVTSSAAMLRAMSYRQALDWARHDPDRLRLVALSRGYKRGWVYHRLREQSAAP
jgi:hypothetical protein